MTDNGGTQIHEPYANCYVRGNGELIVDTNKGCFDKFIDISLLNEIEAAKISREIGIDIAVDLMCYTGNYNKFGIFTKRCAPLQVNFLGYPGTSGSNFIDYIIVDGKIVDDVNKEYFSEHPEIKLSYIENIIGKRMVTG